MESLIILNVIIKKQNLKISILTKKINIMNLALQIVKHVNLKEINKLIIALHVKKIIYLDQM